MGRKARTICILDGREIEVGKRSIHLVEAHGLTPPERWLEKYELPRDLKVIADAMKKDRDLRPSFKWMSEYFKFPDC